MHFRFNVRHIEFRQSVDYELLPGVGQIVDHINRRPNTSITEVYPRERHIVCLLIKISLFPTFRPHFRSCPDKTDVDIYMNLTVFKTSEYL